MKIALISDLHLEFAWIEVAELEIPADVDVILLAGDLHPRLWVRREYIKELETIAPVIFIPGNHDYYANDNDEPWALERMIGGKKIAAAVLWTDLTKKERWERYATNLIDAKLINDWTHERYKRLHSVQKQFLFESEADVIMSHHAPSYKSVSEYFDGNWLNCCFASALDEEILALKKIPKLWVHGHMHTPADYMIGPCRVVLWPRGYPSEDNFKGYKAKIIEI